MGGDTAGDAAVGRGGHWPVSPNMTSCLLRPGVLLGRLWAGRGHSEQQGCPQNVTQHPSMRLCTFGGAEGEMGWTRWRDHPPPQLHQQLTPPAPERAPVSLHLLIIEALGMQ